MSTLLQVLLNLYIQLTSRLVLGLLHALLDLYYVESEQLQRRTMDRILLNIIYGVNHRV